MIKGGAELREGEDDKREQQRVLRAASSLLFAKSRPLEYLYSFLRRGIRPGMRPISSARDVIVSGGSSASSSSSSSSAIRTADSSATVRLGTGTAVVCRLFLEVAEPSHATPDHGFLDVTCHLPPLCSPRFSLSGTTAEQALVTAELLRSTLVCGEALDLSKLCIVVRVEIRGREEGNDLLSRCSLFSIVDSSFTFFSHSVVGV